MDSLLLGSLDPNLASLVVFAIVVVTVGFFLVMVYYMTIAKNPKLLSHFLRVVEKGIEGFLWLLRRQ